MKTSVYYIATALLACISSLNGQMIVSGIVTDRNAEPIIGANIYIEGSYDGAVTELDGTFSFTTDLTGEQSLLVSYLGYESKTITNKVTELSDLQVKLRESASTLDAVEISASTFKAGDNSKLAVLKPLDMVTTAGSMGDVIAAIQTLPGTQSNTDDGRLFVRGGDANETKIYIDGMRVFSPYTRAVQGTPSRGRYSPFLFKGTSFSTGGYDTEFGQALSGVLDMSTIDTPSQTESNLGLMTVGLAAGHTQKWDQQSISLSSTYIDLTPYYWIAPTRLNLDKPFRVFSGELVHRYNIDDGLIKTYIAGDTGGVSLSQENLNTQEDEAINILNKNIYINSSMTKLLTDKTSTRIGVSYGNNDDDLEVDSFHMDQGLEGLHLKATFKTILNDFHIINYGAEVISQTNTVRSGFGSDIVLADDRLQREQYALFASTDYFFNKDFAVKLGLRSEYNSLLQKTEIDPRITLAYKLGKNGQVSAAYGHFHQEIGSPFLYSNTAVGNEKARHYLLNYNFKNEKIILRLEGYYKDYSDLVTYDLNNFQFEQVSNDGFGTAYGFDLFFRANNLIKYVDFWVSYSWLQNERLYQNFPSPATPSFSTDHNFSLVTKTWFEKLNSQLGVTYSLASGRPFDDRNTSAFMTERSSMFHNVSLSWSYLITQQKILFVSVSNAPGFRNEFGYRYADQPDMNGYYRSEKIRPNDDRFFFMGFFVTFSEDKTKNQLDTL